MHFFILKFCKAPEKYEISNIILMMKIYFSILFSWFSENPITYSFIAE